MLIEGQEKDEFWKILGGEKEYSKDPRLPVSNFKIICQTS